MLRVPSGERVGHDRAGLCDEALGREERRPRREVVVPGYYQLAIWLERMLPGLVDALLSRRGQ